jgi:hypothetical protein
LGGGAMVPYIGSWTGEDTLPTTVIRLPAGGIGYSDETLLDRDERGVLWTRTAARIGAGRPLFTKLHPQRQRRAMRHLLCQVCARPADHTSLGTLWLLPDDLVLAWEDGLGDVVTGQPPMCQGCARISVRMCPALRVGHVALRAHSRVYGVRGVVFRPAGAFGLGFNDDVEVVSFGDPRLAWTQATQLMRELFSVRTVDLEQLS